MHITDHAHEYGINKARVCLVYATVQLSAFCWAATIKFPRIHEFPDLSRTLGLFSGLFIDISQIPRHFQVSRDARKVVTLSITCHGRMPSSASVLFTHEH